jgi:hypothetical protein
MQNYICNYSSIIPERMLLFKVKFIDYIDSNCGDMN